MENLVKNDAQFLNLNEEIIEKVVNTAERVIKNTLDISVETNVVLSMTPKDGYEKKLDLIYSAEDMSTEKKLLEIEKIEKEYAERLEQNAELCKDIMWKKVGMVLTLVSGSIYFVTSEKGQKVIKNVLCRIA